MENGTKKRRGFCRYQKDRPEERDHFQKTIIKERKGSQSFSVSRKKDRCSFFCDRFTSLQMIQDGTQDTTPNTECIVI